MENVKKNINNETNNNETNNNMLCYSPYDSFNTLTIIHKCNLFISCNENIMNNDDVVGCRYRIKALCGH